MPAFFHLLSKSLFWLYQLQALREEPLQLGALARGLPVVRVALARRVEAFFAGAALRVAVRFVVVLRTVDWVLRERTGFDFGMKQTPKKGEDGFSEAGTFAGPQRSA